MNRLLSSLYLGLGLSIATIVHAHAGTESNPQTTLHATWQCQADTSSGSRNWQVMLDDSLPLAEVDGEDTPAEYSPSHARILLAVGGPNLFIGRHSGRLVVSSADGKTIGKGQCSAGLAT